ncbi:MAG: YqaE/Pmp3 family membrane protein [Ginsengibacter sp.]
MKQTSLLIFSVIFLALSTVNSFAAFVIPNTIGVEDPAKPGSKTVSSALSEFMHLSRKERKSRIREAKTEIKKIKAEKKAGAEPSTNTLLLVILAILLPPLAVYLHEGEINNKFWLDLILTLLFFLPGVIYALIVVLKKD